MRVGPLIDRELVADAERQRQSLLDEGHSEAYADRVITGFLLGLIEGRAKMLVRVATSRFGPLTPRQRIALQLIARVDAAVEVVSSRLMRVATCDEVLSGFTAERTADEASP